MKSSAELQNLLNEHIKDFLPDNDFKDVLLYSLIPAGKLFRPKLVHALAHDLGQLTQNHFYLASSLEVHHTYTLIHDDLPAMDNDDYRRGKLSSHKKFNEFKAILAGDALLNISFGLLSSIEHKSLNTLLKLYSEYTGAKGLILGQVLDLENSIHSIESILEIHTLKTARLIQLALEGSYLLTDSQIDQKIISNLGLAIGISFQLLDDLSELTEDINDHELKINPFINLNSKSLFTILNKNLDTIQQTLDEYNLNESSKIMNEYFFKMSKIIQDGEKEIQKRIQGFLFSNLKL